MVGQAGGGGTWYQGWQLSGSWWGGLDVPEDDRGGGWMTAKDESKTLVLISIQGMDVTLQKASDGEAILEFWADELLV